jgi:hypothetical protein
MGGSIRIVVRFSDGTVQSKTRHTNPLPSVIRSPQFIAGDEGFMRSYLDRRSEYESDDRIAPCEYGIAVFDYITRYALSYNNYSDFQGFYIDDLESTRDRLSQREKTDDTFDKMVELGQLCIRTTYRSDPLATAETVITRDHLDRWDEIVMPLREREGGDLRSKIGVLFKGWDFEVIHPSRRTTVHERKADRRHVIAKLQQLGIITKPLGFIERRRWAEL